MSDQPDRPDDKRPPTDLRRFQKESERRLLFGALILLLLVGGGLIAILLGPRQALGAAPCLLAGAAVLIGLYVLLLLAERWVNR
jgi:hypothetical protein